MATVDRSTKMMQSTLHRIGTCVWANTAAVLVLFCCGAMGHLVCEDAIGAERAPTSTMTGKHPPVSKTPSANDSLVWLTSHAESGDVWAMAFLGRTHLMSIAKSVRKRENDTQFDGHGYPEAERPYWNRYHQILESSSFHGDDQTAIQWLRKAAAAGNSEAMVDFGMAYDIGVGVGQDYAKSRQWLRKAADVGTARAMYELGYLYDMGWGVQKDRTQAMQWYRKAADAGHVEAMCNLASLEIRWEQALLWWRKAADAGSSKAMLRVGLSYEMGVGVERDFAKAAQWYRKAADAGVADAMNDMGRLYEYGRGMKKDYAQAMQWYRRAAEAGLTKAMCNIGAMYKQGVGVTKNYVEAMHWYRNAAAAGNVDAMYNIGELYYNGLGVSKDEAEAVWWFRKGAALGDTVCIMRLSELSSSDGNGKRAGVEKQKANPNH